MSGHGGRSTANVRWRTFAAIDQVQEPTFPPRSCHTRYLYFFLLVFLFLLRFRHFVVHASRGVESRRPRCGGFSLFGKLLRAGALSRVVEAADDAADGTLTTIRGFVSGDDPVVSSGDAKASRFSHAPVSSPDCTVTHAGSCSTAGRPRPSFSERVVHTLYAREKERPTLRSLFLGLGCCTATPLQAPPPPLPSFICTNVLTYQCHTLTRFSAKFAWLSSHSE